jgi:hypothetical protein
MGVFRGFRVIKKLCTLFLKFFQKTVHPLSQVFSKNCAPSFSSFFKKLCTLFLKFFQKTVHPLLFKSLLLELPQCQKCQIASGDFRFSKTSSKHSKSGLKNILIHGEWPHELSLSIFFVKIFAQKQEFSKRCFSEGRSKTRSLEKHFFPTSPAPQAKNYGGF